MLKAAVLSTVLLGVAACSNDKPAPLASGEWQVLNAGQWDVNPVMVQAPVMPKAPK